MAATEEEAGEFFMADVDAVALVVMVKEEVEEALDTETVEDVDDVVEVDGVVEAAVAVVIVVVVSVLVFDIADKRQKELSKHKIVSVHAILIYNDLFNLYLILN